MEFTVSRLGKPLSPNLYHWDEKTLTFTSQQSHLVLDFANWNNVTFKTSTRCVFKTNSYCTFNTGSGCIFDTGHGCTFKTGGFCTFDTLSHCTFETGADCMFDTGSECTFKTGENCVIINRETNDVIRLNNKENYYDMKEKQVRFEDITVFKNRENINLALQITDLEQLRKLLEDKDLITKLEREVFDKLI